MKIFISCLIVFLSCGTKLSLGKDVSRNQVFNIPKADTLNLNLGFALAVNEEKEIKDSNLKMKVLEINDGRCPANVKCKRGGEVKVKFLLTSNQEEKIINLATPIHEMPNLIRLVKIEGFIITLQDARPYPLHPYDETIVRKAYFSIIKEK